MTTHLPASAELLVKEINVLVSLPDICLRLREILVDPEHSRRDVADVIQYDPALSARVLRIVNCAYFGLPSRISSISQALGILGELELRNLVFVTAIVDRLSAGIPGFDLPTFWKSSVLAAVISRTCARDLPRERQEEYFLTGLLLNVGKLALYRKEPELYAAVRELQRTESCADHTAERALIGFDHADVGAVLAAAWNFPAALGASIVGHHAAAASTTHLDATTHLASWAADQMLEGGPCTWQALTETGHSASLLTQLELDDVGCDALLAYSLSEFERVHDAFFGSPRAPGSAP